MPRVGFLWNYMYSCITCQNTFKWLVFMKCDWQTELLIWQFPLWFISWLEYMLDVIWNFTILNSRWAGNFISQKENWYHLTKIYRSLCGCSMLDLPSNIQFIGSKKKWINRHLRDYISVFFPIILEMLPVPAELGKWIHLGVKLGFFLLSVI